MKKKLFALTMAMLIVLTSSIACYADTITPRDTNYIIYTTDRLSRTKADVMVDVAFVEKVDRFNVVIYLQKRVNGEWVLDSTNDEYVFYNNGFRKKHFTFSPMLIAPTTARPMIARVA